MKFDKSRVWKLCSVSTKNDNAGYNVSKEIVFSEKDFIEYDKNEKFIRSYISLIEMWDSTKESILEFYAHFKLNKEDADNINNINSVMEYPHSVSRESCRKMIKSFFLYTAFADHANALFTRKYGEGSKEYKAWKALTGKEFDDWFSYRFVCQLRNYTQHVGLPQFQWQYSKKDSTCILNFYTESLLGDYSRWKSSVRIELEAMPPKIDAMNIMNEWRMCIWRILHGVIEILKDDVKNSASKIAGFRSNFSDDGVIQFWNWPLDTEGRYYVEVRLVEEENAKLIMSGYPLDENGVLTI